MLINQKSTYHVKFVLTIFAIGLSNICVYDTAPTKYLVLITQFSLEEFHKTGKKKPQTKKKKKIFAEVLQHAIAAAALDSSCSQSHHAIKKFAFVINHNDVHTYVVRSDGIKRSRKPTDRQAGKRLRSSLIPLRINEKILMYIPDFVCEFIMTYIRTYCFGGMAVTKKRSIPSDPNPEVVVYIRTYDDEFERFRIPSTLALAAAAESPTMLSLKLHSASPLPITVQSAALERSTVRRRGARARL